MTITIILLAALLLAYANGANDNFKGVATLFGSGTANYRWSLGWATATTFLGSLVAILLAGRLLANFTGKGLVDSGLVATPDYAAAVAMGAGLTVLLATRIGLPVSTTHGLVGALVGAGIAAGSSINAAQLTSSFVIPLLVSPFLAFGLTAVCYPLLHRARLRLGVTEETCFCVESQALEVVPELSPDAALRRVDQLSLRMGRRVDCERRYAGNVLGLDAGSALDMGHYFSCGVVSFARGLNDTPKIAALLLLAPQFSAAGSVALIAVIIALGGLISAGKVAETMSHRITPMNHGQGFTANLVTGLLVIGASRMGVPVSTTHVSCGTLFGVGTSTRQGNARTILEILAAWVVTLPLGALLGGFGLATLRLLA